MLNLTWLILATLPLMPAPSWLENEKNISPPCICQITPVTFRNRRQKTAFLLAAETQKPQEWLAKQTETETEPSERNMYSILLGFFFNTIGFGYFMYGKKQERYIILIVGLSLMIYPYLLVTPFAIAGIGVTLCMAPSVLKRFGIYG